jgi:ATP-dependent Clp protease ATP-binding subunit ClpC
MEMEPLMTSDEVAAYLRVDVVTVRRLVTRGELSAYRIGGEYRFARADLLDYLERQHLPAQVAERQPVGSSPSATRLTRRARRGLQLAADEARAGGSGYVGTEHLLLGLIAEREGLAARALEGLGIAPEAVRAALAAGQDWPEHSAASAAVDGELTEQAQRAVDAALSQAVEWEHDYVGTEHLLFSLTRVVDGNITLLLEQLGTAPDMVQDEVLRLVKIGGAR